MYDFKIHMPTEEELKKRCGAQYARASHSFMDKLPDEWIALSMKTKLLELTKDDLRTIIGGHGDKEDIEHNVNNRDELAARIDGFLGWEVSFVKLNSRSAKDVTDEPFTCSGKQVLTWFSQSERILEDCLMFLRVDGPAYLVARECVYCPSEFEFRCFVVNGELQAIAQYDYSKSMLLLQGVETRNRLSMMIGDWWRDEMRPHTPADYPENYVFDVLIDHKKVTLIEVNPYGLSDPCSAQSYKAIKEDGGFFFEQDPTPKGSPNE